MARPPRTWLAGRTLKLPAWSDALRARLDPRRDGWPSEAHATRVTAELERALDAALGPGADGAALRALGTATFGLERELVPRERTVLLDDGVVLASEARAFGAVPDLAAALAGWREALGSAKPAGARSVRAEVAVETWTEGPEGVSADLAVRVLGTGGARVQTTHAFRSMWLLEAGVPRLARLEPQACTVVELAQPIVQDATAGALGREPWFKSDVLLGTDARHGRRDRLGLDPFLGMHGLAVGDFDADGLEDLYVCQGSGIPNRLLHHERDGTARDVAQPAGVAFLDSSSTALAADMDGDRDEDLIVATGNVLLLCWNDGRGAFPEGGLLTAPDAPEIYSLAAADVDLDGDLDLFACRYVEGGLINGAPTPYHDARNGAKNLFWRNEGGRRFRECAAEVGLDANYERFSLAAVFEDMDDDGDVDLHVTNDFGRNSLYRNDAGRFTDVAAAAGAEDVAASMGSAIGDVDLDGDLDIYDTNMESAAGSRIARADRFLPDRGPDRAFYVRNARGCTLLRGDGPLRFTDELEASGARRGGWAWGATFTDWNEDGLLDIFVPNGFLTMSRTDDLESFFWRVVIASTPAIPPPTEAYLQAWQFVGHMAHVEGWSWNGRERDDAFLNVGGGRFVDFSRAAGLDFECDGRSAARCDWDGDGLDDLWAGSRTAPRVRLLLGAHPRAGRTVAFDLVGTRQHAQAIGATVHVEAGGKKLRGSVRVGDGYLTTSSKRVLIGLGAAERVDAVRVRWPGGELESFTGVEPGARWRLVEGQGRAVRVDAPRARPACVDSPWIPAAIPGVGRIVLDDRLPLSKLELPGAGRPRRVESFAGRTLLVALGRASDPETASVFGLLAGARTELEAAHINAWALAIADSGREDVARALLKEHGFAGAGGIADARTLQLLEVLLLEVLGPFEHVPLPLVLLVDRGGSLALVRCGPLEAESLRADTRAVARLEPNARGTESLLGGGRWARKPERALGSVADVLQRLGHAELSAWYRECARSRAAPAPQPSGVSR